MVERVILPVFCVEFFTGQNAYAREHYYPDLHLAGIGVSKWLKLAADEPRGEIVVYEASIAGRVFLGASISHSSWMREVGYAISSQDVWPPSA